MQVFPSKQRNAIADARDVWLAYNNPYVQGDTKKTGTFEKPNKTVKHFYGESTLLTVPLTHDY